MRTFSWRIKNSRILSCFNSNNFLFLSNNLQFWHTKWTSVMILPRNSWRIRNHGWLFKVFFTALVWAMEFFLRTVGKKVHPTFPSQTSCIATFNKLCQAQKKQPNCTTQIRNNKNYGASSGLWSRGLLLTRQPLYQAEPSGHQDAKQGNTNF